MFVTTAALGAVPIQGTEVLDNSPHQDAPLAADPEHRPKEVHAHGYVGSKVCQTCHAKEYKTWHASYHRTMTQAATPTAVLGDFTNVNLMLYGKQIRLWRQTNQFWAELPDPSWQGDEHQRPQIKRQIVQVTGSHHMQVYWYPTGRGRELGPVPFVWVISDKRWFPRDAMFLTPQVHSMAQTLETGRWNFICLQCHTTGAEPRIQFSPDGNDVFDSQVGEFGISCEACHGPGEQHVNQRREEEKKKTSNHPAELIVPSHLPPERSSQVCGQCHSVYAYRSEADFLTWSQTGFRYRPGDDLKTSGKCVLSVGSGDPEVEALFKMPGRATPDTQFWSDGMIRVSGREYNGLIQSPCYQHEKKGHQLSCFSCHQMHPNLSSPQALAAWADGHQVKPVQQPNQACTQCHEKYKEASFVKAHTHHRAGSSGSDCYNCHMPYTTYGILKALRSHQISSPNVQASLSTGRPNACNQCHLDKTLAWSADHLHEWYEIPKPVLGEDQRSVAASILWSLTGDAGQRALMAWSLGWPEAREISGSNWMTPYLTQLLNDNYEAVRIIALRSFRKQEGFEKSDYDPFSSLPQRLEFIQQIKTKQFAVRPGEQNRPTNPHLLFGPDGQLNQQEFARLLSQQNGRKVELSE